MNQPSHFDSYLDYTIYCYLEGIKPTLEGWRTNVVNVSSRPVTIFDDKDFDTIIIIDPDML